MLGPAIHTLQSKYIYCINVYHMNIASNYIY
jgi:hypothetical protein